MTDVEDLMSLIGKLLPSGSGTRPGVNDFLSYLDQKRKNAASTMRDFSANPVAMLQMMGRQVGEDLTSQASTGLTSGQKFMEGMKSIMPDVRRSAIDQGVSMAAGMTPLQTVYHGSPHKFDQFDMSKIGTGEGAQAYGHGLYFSEAPTVAKSYQGSVSAQHGTGKPTIGGRPVNWDDPMETAAFELSRHDGNRAAAADFFERTFKKSEVPAILRSDKPLPKVDLPGNLYKVDLPDEHIAKMLDWDKPLSQQKHLFDKTGPHGPNFAFKDLLEHFQIDPSATGGELMQQMGMGRSAEKAAAISKTLKDYDIPGIRYLDQGSRTNVDVAALRNRVKELESYRNSVLSNPELQTIDKGQKLTMAQRIVRDNDLDISELRKKIAEAEKPRTSNYVVFDDKLLKILGRE